MTLKTQLTVVHVALSEADRRRIERRLRALERRLVHHPDPTASLLLRPYPGGREVEADLRVQLGPLGRHLVSRRAAGTAAHAVRLAAEAAERQLERQHADQRGEPTFGVPSRRLPAHLRPHPPGTGAGDAPAYAAGDVPGPDRRPRDADAPPGTRSAPDRSTGPDPDS